MSNSYIVKQGIHQALRLMLPLHGIVKVILYGIGNGGGHMQLTLRSSYLGSKRSAAVSHISSVSCSVLHVLGSLDKAG